MCALAGKYISILGASTSTFDGISNSAQYNTTLPINAPYYPKPEYMDNADDTWWMRTIHALDLRLCVNNSWSGSCITTMTDGAEKAACMLRATQLHNDVQGIEPDIIVLMIGGNDGLRGYDVGEYHGVGDVYDAAAQAYVGDCTLFGQAYATMVHKVQKRYPAAEIIVCSMLHWQPTKHDKGLLAYNEIIRRIAEEFGVTYADLYNGTPIAPETAQTYLHTDGLHPNRKGFAEMAACIVRLLQEKHHG